MADLSGRFSSLLQSLKLRPRPGTQSTVQDPKPLPKKNNEPLVNEAKLRSFSDAELKTFLAEQPEPAITRILSNLTDPPLQMRVIQLIDAESMLKRISRSQLNKKMRRAAEKKLRATGATASQLKLGKTTELAEQMRVFLKNPAWDKAEDLLALVSEPGLVEDEAMNNSPLVMDFHSLRRRVKKEVEAYDRTCAEMEELLSALCSSQALSKSALGKIHDRWQDLSEKYSFPKNFPIFKKYDEALTKRLTPRPLPEKVTPADSPAPTLPDPSVESEKARRKLETEQRLKVERERRLASLENLLEKIREVEKRLVHRKAAQELRTLQNEVAGLRRWRREYPAQLDEAEALLKTLEKKRSEAIKEAEWNIWAKTDLATQIQTKLEKLIGELEGEQDPEVALKNSVGLTGQLHEYSKEMRSFGSLDRDRDRKIWDQFKTLSDRGWAVCDRMKLLVLERFKTLLSPHLSRQVEFTLETLSSPSASITFLPSAFSGEVPAKVREMRVMWLEIGTKTSAENRDLEIVFSKLFETYTRQANLLAGRAKRVEDAAVQAKRDLLKEMQIACEGKSTLVSRAEVARRIEERWKKAPLPASAGTELQNEFDGYRARMNAEVAGEIEKKIELLGAVKIRSEELLGKILAKDGTGVSSALKTITGFENELLGTEKYLGQFKSPSQAEVALDGSPEKRFRDLRGQTWEILQQGKAAIKKETDYRIQERTRLLQEAEGLALSTDWETTRARFEELKALWKKMGVLGQSEDAAFGSIFENVSAFFQARLRNKDLTLDPVATAKNLKLRKDLLYSLEALARFIENKESEKSSKTKLPFSEDELRTLAPGKLLEYGMKYHQILALDPVLGTVKETKKIMEEWVKIPSVDEESLPDYWKYYLERAHSLLKILKQ
jgi:hypothetical protein